MALRTASWIGSAALTAGLVTGCSANCEDDGLVQDDPSNCAVASGEDGGESSTGGPAIPIDTEGASDTSGSGSGSATSTGSDPDTSGGETDTGAESSSGSDTDSGGGSCSNGRLDDGEADIDCGGVCDSPCDDGSDCTQPSDCASGVCDEGTCAAPACDDGVHNGDETDADCGGETCEACEDGFGCDDADDCTSGICDRNVCVAPTCKDGQHNGDETDVDCGGTCGPCDDGEGCGGPSDCTSGVCTDDVCTAATCDDGVQNGTETDVDCGGDTCDGCNDGQTCGDGDDCLSGVCTDDVCVAPTCDDGVRNGDETDIDCGGDSCDACPDGNSCEDGSDCLSTLCEGDVCTPMPASCLEILLDDPAAVDGPYSIDPDGLGGVAPLTVQCDMSTDGGGWTGITPCIAQTLGSTMVAVEPAAVEGIDAQCRPFTQDAGNQAHTYHYTFTFAPTFTEFYLADYEAQANGSGAGNTADIGPFVQSDWALCHQGTHGDISFGSADDAGPVTSFAAEGTDVDTVNALVPWPSDGSSYAVGAATSGFRIGWGEEGSQSEGWIPWASGSVFVR